MILEAPKFLTPSEIHIFLKKVEYFFNGKKNENDFRLTLHRVKKNHFLAILILYKLMEYSFTRNRFIQPLIILDDEGRINNDFELYGFKELIQDFVSENDGLREFKRLKIIVENNFFLAPQALLRDESYTRTSLQQKVLPQIESYYNNSKASIMIFTCLSEILLNFWEHAVEDTQSVLVSRGTKQVIEIACADTGKGIISTLKPILGNSLSGRQIMEKAVEMGVTSKKNSNHMGFGLWLLSRFVSMVGGDGRMHLYSEGIMYRNEGGKVVISDCGFWQGTIIYISLPTLKPVTIEDVPELKNNTKFADIKINFL